MGPPNGLKNSDPSGSADILSSPFLLAQYPGPKPVDSVEGDSKDYDRKTAQSLDELSRGCSDSICAKSQAWAGGIYLAQNDPDDAKKVYNGMAQYAGADKDNKHVLLARGLIALQEGRILDAKTLLTPIATHPYAKVLLKLINQNDDFVLSLQTLSVLKALVEDERLKKSEDPTLPRVKSFLEEAEVALKASDGPDLKDVFSKIASDSAKNFSDMPETLEKFADGLGGEILRAASNPRPDLRAQLLFSLVNEKLLPTHRSGTAYVIGKILEKNPETGPAAQSLLARLNGIKLKNEEIINDYIIADMLDNGLTSFLASYAALLPGRMASSWVWGRWAAKYGPEMTWGRRLAGYGLSLAGGTAVYYASEKSLLGLFGFDGQILPKSGGEFAREFGSDMIVMGLANLYGGGRKWMMKERLETQVPGLLTRSRPVGFWQKVNPLRLLPPLYPKKFLSQWHWLLYKSAPVRNDVTKLIEDGYKMRGGWKFLLQTSKPFVYGGLLHSVHRWQDNSGMMPRFRPGKTTRILRMPTSWQDQLLQGYQIQSAEGTLGQLLNHLMTVRNNTVTDKLYSRIVSLKQWVAKLNPAATPEQEEILMGVFWVAQDQGSLGGGAPDLLLKWNKEKRFDKMNEYFKKKKIPLEVSSFGDLQLISE